MRRPHLSAFVRNGVVAIRNPFAVILSRAKDPCILLSLSRSPIRVCYPPSPPAQTAENTYTAKGSQSATPGIQRMRPPPAHSRIAAIARTETHPHSPRTPSLSRRLLENPLSQFSAGISSAPSSIRRFVRTGNARGKPLLQRIQPSNRPFVRPLTSPPRQVGCGNQVNLLLHMVERQHLVEEHQAGIRNTQLIRRRLRQPLDLPHHVIAEKSHSSSRKRRQTRQPCRCVAPPGPPSAPQTHPPRTRCVSDLP